MSILYSILDIVEVYFYSSFFRELFLSVFCLAFVATVPIILRSIIFMRGK